MFGFSFSFTTASGAIQHVYTVLRMALQMLLCRGCATADGVVGVGCAAEMMPMMVLPLLGKGLDCGRCCRLRNLHSRRANETEEIPVLRTL